MVGKYTCLLISVLSKAIVISWHFKLLSFFPPGQ